MLIFLGSIALVVILLLSEMPIAFAFGIGALVFGLASGSDISFLIPFAYQTTSSFALLALPLFVMAGTIMAEGGMSDRLLAFVNALVGRLKGGLGAVTIVTCALFGAISGSSSAAIAAIGSIMIPRMVREGYPPGHATALVACSSVLALMIPPSMTRQTVSAIALGRLLVRRPRRGICTPLDDLLDRQDHAVELPRVPRWFM